MDTEWEQIVRDLRRRALPGDPANRAATWIEQNAAVLNAGHYGAPALPGEELGTGLRDINASADRAQAWALRRQPPLPADHDVRNMMTKETLGILRQDRDHELASEENRNDYEYIEYIRLIYGGTYAHVGKMIALTARHAGELPHDLIHPTVRTRIENRLHAEGHADPISRLRDVQTELGRIGNITWETFVDPGLACNARIACNDIANLLPRLWGMNMSHVVAYSTRMGTSEHADMFTDFFCSVVACTWRFNSVMAAQPYKTKNEHAAVQLALKVASQRLRDFALVGGSITHDPRRPPGSLAEARDRDHAVFRRDDCRCAERI